MSNRKIIHVDMDCFYAAVEEKYNPKLRGLPVAVGGSPQSRSVICTANYAARKFGVKAAVPSSRAIRLCPQLVLIPPHFDLYKKESKKVREIFARFTDRIQPLSLDEAYLDVTDSIHCQGSATLMAEEIRRQILSETGLTASAGIAPNKFLAKVASDWRKPNGQFVIRPQDIESLMRDLPVEKIWGVGKVTAAKMHQIGLKTCGDLQKLSLSELRRHFGEARAIELIDICRGIDERPVRSDQQRKSLSIEETFSRDLGRLEDILKVLPSLYQDWSERLDRSRESAPIRSAVIKLKYFDFASSTHEMTCARRPQEADFEQLLRAAWERRSAPIRLLGLGVRFQVQDQVEETAQLQFALSG